MRHVHAATSDRRFAVEDHYNERNRLLVTTRDAAAGRRRRAAVGRYLAITRRTRGATSWRRCCAANAPDPRSWRRRLRAFGAYVAGTPDVLRGATE